jgi:hypothetical protein
MQQDETKRDQTNEMRLDWQDYVARVVALLQTSLLPFLLLIAALIVIGIILTVVWTG